jgi:hypothetical protein
MNGAIVPETNQVLKRLTKSRCLSTQYKRHYWGCKTAQSHDWQHGRLCGEGMLNMEVTLLQVQWHHVNSEDFPGSLLWLLAGSGDAECFAYRVCRLIGEADEY